MSQETLLSTDAKMRKAIDTLKRELATIRSGRAHPELVAHIRVDYMGTTIPINQIAGIVVPEARLLIIQPWDRQALPSIEKAILKSDLGLNPSSDGNVIRLAIPQLTGERRQELVRMVRKRAEEGRVAIRNLRREAMEELSGLKQDKRMSEDEHKRAREQLQRLTDSFIEEIDQVVKDKEAELLEA